MFTLNSVPVTLEVPAYSLPLISSLRIRELCSDSIIQLIEKHLTFSEISEDNLFYNMTQ